MIQRKHSSAPIHVLPEDLALFERMCEVGMTTEETPLKAKVRWARLHEKVCDKPETLTYDDIQVFAAQANVLREVSPEMNALADKLYPTIQGEGGKWNTH
jgi:hypothetical protein